jgi:hypothetical protein
MSGMEKLQSRPYQPDPKMACEKCVFGHGSHAAWCRNVPWIGPSTDFDRYLASGEFSRDQEALAKLRTLEAHRSIIEPKDLR